jgi:hypothetical protein
MLFDDTYDELYDVMFIGTGFLGALFLEAEFVNVETSCLLEEHSDDTDGVIKGR